MLIYNHHSYITAKRLAREIGIQAESEKRNRNMPVIRYGSSKYFGYDNPQINTIESIRKASNKLYTLEVLAENDISVPQVFYKVEDIEKYPVLARNIYHKQGRDIILCESEEDLYNDEYKTSPIDRDYLVEFIEAKGEYRIHCIDNEIVKIFRKTNESTTPPEIQRFLEATNRVHNKEENFIRCARLGWGFYKVNMEQDWLEPMKSKALKSLQTLGLYFGAVDVIHSVDGKFVVLEVNSAPALNTDTLIIYAEKLRQWLEENYEMERIYRTSRNKR